MGVGTATKLILLFAAISTLATANANRLKVHSSYGENEEAEELEGNDGSSNAATLGYAGNNGPKREETMRVYEEPNSTDEELESDDERLEAMNSAKGIGEQISAAEQTKADDEAMQPSAVEEGEDNDYSPPQPLKETPPATLETKTDDGHTPPGTAALSKSGAESSTANNAAPASIAITNDNSGCGTEGCFSDKKKNEGAKAGTTEVPDILEIKTAINKLYERAVAAGLSVSSAPQIHSIDDANSALDSLETSMKSGQGGANAENAPPEFLQTIRRHQISNPRFVQKGDDEDMGEDIKEAEEAEAEAGDRSESLNEAEADTKESEEGEAEEETEAEGETVEKPAAKQKVGPIEKPEVLIGGYVRSILELANNIASKNLGFDDVLGVERMTKAQKAAAPKAI